MLLVAPIQIWIARRSHFQWCFYYCAYHRNVRNLLTKIFWEETLELHSETICLNSARWWRGEKREWCAVQSYKLPAIYISSTRCGSRILEGLVDSARFCLHSTLELSNRRKFGPPNWDVLFSEGVGPNLDPGVNPGYYRGTRTILRV